MGLQGAYVYPSPRPSRGEGGRSLRSGVAPEVIPPGFPGFSYVFVRWWSVACSGFGLQGAGVASELFAVVRQWSVVSFFPPVGGRAPCRSVRRFQAFRPRTPCFCNPLMVSQEQPDYVLSSVLKTDVSTAISAKSQGVRAFLDSRVLTVHFRSLAGAE